jgi:hypothetical protein
VLVHVFITIIDVGEINHFLGAIKLVAVMFISLLIQGIVIVEFSVSCVVLPLAFFT